MTNIINAQYRFYTDEILEILFNTITNELHYETFFVKEPSEFKVQELEKKRDEIVDEMYRRYGNRLNSGLTTL